MARLWRLTWIQVHALPFGFPCKPRPVLLGKGTPRSLLPFLPPPGSPHSFQPRLQAAGAECRVLWSPPSGALPPTSRTQDESLLLLISGGGLFVGTSLSPKDHTVRSSEDLGSGRHSSCPRTRVVRLTSKSQLQVWEGWGSAAQLEFAWTPECASDLDRP